MITIESAQALPALPPFTVIIATQGTPEKLQQTQQCAQLWTEGLSDCGCAPIVLTAVGKGSISEAYNTTLASVTTPYVVLAHNDAFPPVRLNRKIGRRLLDHMNNHKLDLAGFCGSSKFIGARWQDATSYLYGSVFNVPMPTPQPQPMSAVLWQRPARVVLGIRVLDGYCLVARTKALQENPFDPLFSHWHCYDCDQTLTFHARGLRTAVICDVSVLHQSVVGYADPNWATECPKFLKKWAGKADPLMMGSGITPSQVQSGDPSLILLELERLEQFMAPVVEG